MDCSVLFCKTARLTKEAFSSPESPHSHLSTSTAFFTRTALSLSPVLSLLSLLQQQARPWSQPGTHGCVAVLAGSEQRGRQLGLSLQTEPGSWLCQLWRPLGDASVPEWEQLQLPLGCKPLEPARLLEAAILGKGVAGGLLMGGRSLPGQAALLALPCLGLLARFTGRSSTSDPHLLGHRTRGCCGRLGFYYKCSPFLACSQAQNIKRAS